MRGERISTWYLPTVVFRKTWIQQVSSHGRQGDEYDYVRMCQLLFTVVSHLGEVIEVDLVLRRVEGKTIETGSKIIRTDVVMRGQ